MRRASLTRCLLLAAVMATPLAHAELPPSLDRVSLWLGGYFPDTALTLRAATVDGSLATGELELASGHETVGRARAEFLLFDRQGFTFDYYTLDRTTTQLLTSPFSFQGVPFQLDSTITGTFDFTAASAAWHWWIGDADNVFGLGLGAVYYRARFGLLGAATAEGESGTTAVSWEDDAVAPLLNVGWKHAFSDELRAYANASGIWKDSGPLSGHIYDARVGLEWFPWQSFGVGVEYGGTRIRLDRKADLYTADLHVDLDGPSVFARLRF
jgi:hypothetical protein